MAFKRAVTRLSDLIADRVIGAYIATRIAAPRIELIHDTISDTGELAFVLSDDAGHVAGQISASEIFGIVSLMLRPPGTPGKPYTPILALYAGTNQANSEIDLSDFGRQIISRLQFDNAFTFARMTAGDTGNVLTDANGRIFVNHNLGGPSGQVDVLLWSDNHASSPHHGFHLPGSDTGIKFCIQFRKTTDNTVTPAGTTVSGNWLAMTL